MPEAAAPQLPHGIMGLQPQGFPWSFIVLSILSLVLVTLLGWLLWKQLRRKNPAVTTFPSMAPPDPWSRLVQALESLEINEPWDRESCEEFFFRLSFVLRQALELRTGLPVTGQTLAETKASFEKSPALSANFQQDLIKFLSLSEQLKFAGQWLSAAESSEWQEKVKAWMEKLRHGALS